MQFHYSHSIVTGPVKGQAFNPPNEAATLMVHSTATQQHAEVVRRTTAVQGRHTAPPAAAVLPDPLPLVRVPIARTAIVAAAHNRMCLVRTRVTKADKVGGRASPVPIRDAEH